MSTGSEARRKNVALALIGLAVLALAAAYVFRDGFGLVVFLLLGIAAIVQFVRVAVIGGRRKTLEDLWAAFKDAFWGMGWAHRPDCIALGIGQVRHVGSVSRFRPILPQARNAKAAIVSSRSLASGEVRRVERRAGVRLVWAGDFHEMF